MQCEPTTQSEGVPLAGILIYGPLLSMLIWLIVGFAAWMSLS